MGELKSCPFCGATPIIERRDVEPQGDPWYGDKVVRFVLCECGVSLFDRYFHEGFDSNEEAIAAWNHRAPDGQRAGVPEECDARD
ncbi:Lar family restriction alleviation protein [Cupriavidus gilardii]|uniref:Lar family restriction alleviation protein n=1 Tax=Cupriavidus gilardii TaxID=82541 RepID=UPI00158085B9|nr:Lar family restriction alleviation protein [Cupriavidus gilardii]QKS60878.1 Lar family restriction alleviation protein [Cupriavidus gilardii]